VDLSLTALPGLEHLVNSTSRDVDAELAAVHVLVSGHLEVVHGLVKPAPDIPSSQGVSTLDTSMILETLKVAGEECIILLGEAGSVNSAGIGAGTVLADDETVISSEMALEFDTTILGHSVWGVVKDRTKGKEQASSRTSLLEVNITLLEASPETNALHFRESSLGFSEMLDKGGVGKVKSNVDTFLTLIDEGADIRHELTAVCSTEIYDMGAGLEALDHLVGSSLDDRHLILSLVRFVCNGIPLVHASGVCDFLREIALSSKGLGELIVNESEVDEGATDVGDLAIKRVSGRAKRRHVG